MRYFWKRFFQVGLMFAWGGPVILSIVWLILYKTGTITEMSVNEAVLGVLSSTVLAFIAAGISQIHQVESLPTAMKALIQCAVLYIDYAGIYLLNGWIDSAKLGGFTLVFLGVFIAIWLTVYIITRINTEKMNSIIGK